MNPSTLLLVLPALVFPVHAQMSGASTETTRPVLAVSTSGAGEVLHLDLSGAPANAARTAAGRRGSPLFAAATARDQPPHRSRTFRAPRGPTPRALVRPRRMS